MPGNGLGDRVMWRTSKDGRIEQIVVYRRTVAVQPERNGSKKKP
jgi:hypothetical protein